mgnify:CR=1 FL=1
MKRVLPIIIVILLIIGVGGGVVWSILAGREVAAAKVPSYGVPKRRKRLFKRKFRY